MNTPWGISQQVEKIQRGVVWVSTAGHGGLGVAKGTARKVLSDAALLCANYQGGYYWFEEDVQYCIAYYEHPEWDTSLSATTLKDKYKVDIERSYPQYFEYLASGKKAPNEPVVGQTLKVVKQFNSKMDIGTTLEVVEVRSTSFIARHAALGLFRVPKGFVLGEGWQAQILLEAV